MTRITIRLDPPLDSSAPEKARLRFARVSAKAINDALFAGKKEVGAEIDRVFDRPTPYIKGAVKVNKADAKGGEIKGDLRVEGREDRSAAARTLTPHIRVRTLGGERASKGLERALRRMGLLPAGEFAIPSRSEQQDQYGNMPRKRMRDVIAALRGKKGNMFVGAVGRLQTRGVWERDGSRAGITPVMIFVSSVRYQERLRFYDRAQAAVGKSLSNDDRLRELYRSIMRA